MDEIVGVPGIYIDAEILRQPSHVTRRAEFFNSLQQLALFIQGLQ